MLKNKIFIKKLMVTFIALSFFGFIQGQISELPNNIKGFWLSNNQGNFKEIDWKAQWIWLPSEIESDVLLARRSFELSEIPEKAMLKITASSKYELYVNGTYICQGPARSAPHHQSFDILDIKKALILHKNTIAVKVHHQNEKVSYHLNGRAGLLAQLDLATDVKSSQIISNEAWKVSSDPAWNNNSPLVNRFQMIVNDRVDFRKKIKDWNTIQFDDTEWYNARPLLRNSGWPAPQKNEEASTLITPWTRLVPRDIAYLIEHDLEASELLFDKEIPIDTLSKHFKLDLNGDFSTSNSKTKANVLVYDFGKVINGMPQLNIEGPPGTKIQIFTAPYILNNTFISNSVDSNFQDQIILSGQKDNWQALYFKPTRYLAIAIHAPKENVSIHSVGIHQIKYPFKLKGTFSAPEAPWLEELWNAAIKTIDVCTTDAYTDNYRERRQYAQTNYYAALGNYWTSGDYELQRRYLIQIAQEQEANGLMPAYAPLAKDDFMVILDSNCLWIRSLYNYYRYSGDEATVRNLLAPAKKLMALLQSFTNAYGMIDSPPYAYWLDHTLNDRRGANFTLNGHYLGALKDFGKLLEWLNDKDSDFYKLQAQLLSSSLQKYLWDDSKQLFSDALINGKKSKEFSEHANSMALAEGIATQNQAQKIIAILLKKDEHNFIKRSNGLVMVSPAMSYFLHKGVANYGYEQESLELLYKKFGSMLSKNSNGTLWEEWWLDGSGRTGKFQGGRTRSDAQTESAFPPDLIAAFVLGLKVSKPGIKELIVSKPHLDLKKVKASIPTPQGDFKIEWKLEPEKSLTLSIPENMNIKLDLKSLDLGSKKQLIINEKKINLKTKKQNFLIVESGLHRITF